MKTEQKTRKIHLNVLPWYNQRTTVEWDIVQKSIDWIVGAFQWVTIFKRATNQLT